MTTPQAAAGSTAALRTPEGSSHRSASVPRTAPGDRRHHGRPGGASGGASGAPPHSRRTMSTREIIERRLSEMGSYTKYLESVQSSPFNVSLRCNCGRSRPMAWMFVCTHCVLGVFPVKPWESDANGSKDKDKDKDEKEIDEELEAEKKRWKAGDQRPFLCCDLCAAKYTESYFCPNCLNAYPGHYVKQDTRCPRCVACPICTSTLEKIVYAGDSASPASSAAPPTATPDSTDKDASTSPASTSASPATKGPAKDVYLYQCPFCYWSSDTINLKSGDSAELINSLNGLLKSPLEKAKNSMARVKKTYDDKNEALRTEQEKLSNQLRMQSRATRIAAFRRRSQLAPLNPRGGGGKSGMRGGNALGIPELGMLMQGGKRGHKRVPSMNPDESGVLERLEKKLSQKEDKLLFLKHKGEVENIVPQLDMSFVLKFDLTTFAPLSHRLENPLNQEMLFDKHLPQKFHLMAKESYKCPHKTCNSYVCKPTLRGRGATYEVRTAVLEYLPRVDISVKSGDLLATTTSTLWLIFQNRRMDHEGSLTLDPSVNENDELSTASITCLTDTFDIDCANIHIKGTPQKDEKKPGGNFIKGREAHIQLSVKPKFYTEQEIKFSLGVKFSTMLEVLTDDPKAKKGIPKKVTIPYILDFNLGKPRTVEQESTLPPQAAQSALQQTSSRGSQRNLDASTPTSQDTGLSPLPIVQASPSPSPNPQSSGATSVGASDAASGTRGSRTGSHGLAKFSRPASGSGSGANPAHSGGARGARNANSDISQLKARQRKSQQFKPNASGGLIDRAGNGDLPTKKRGSQEYNQ